MRISQCEFRKKQRITNYKGKRTYHFVCTHPDNNGVICPFRGNSLSQACPFWTQKGQKLLFAKTPSQTIAENNGST